MTITGYTPPYGFGNDTTGDPNAPKKKQPGDPDYGLGSSGQAAGGEQYDMPGVAPVASYQRTTYDPANIDLSSPVQLAAGSRSAELMGDAGYQQLLASLGLDEQTARANTQFAQTQAQNKLVNNLSDLGRQSQEDRYGIDATLRSRGVRGSQREALQARAYENQGRSEQNLRNMTADETASLQNQLADTLSQLRRAEATGAGDAAGRLQSQRDAIQARLVQQQSMEQQTAAFQTQNQAIMDALNQMAGQANGADMGTGGAMSQQDATLARLQAMSPEQQAAFRQWIAGANQPGGAIGAPAPAAPSYSPSYTPSYSPQAPAPAPSSPFVAGAGAGAALGSAGSQPKASAGGLGGWRRKTGLY